MFIDCTNQDWTETVICYVLCYILQICATIFIKRPLLQGSFICQISKLMMILRREVVYVSNKISHFQSLRVVKCSSSCRSTSVPAVQLWQCDKWAMYISGSKNISHKGWISCQITFPTLLVITPWWSCYWEMWYLSIA